MKNKPFFGTMLLLCSLILSPVFVAAQTSTSSWDGAGTTPAQWQMFRGWRQSSEFQQQIAALGSVAVQSVPVPVLFGVALSNISPNFGDPRDGGARSHLGEDIMVAKGTPIVSPTAAVVLRTGVGSGEGNYVTTANPGGETFVYMHLDRFGEGVAAGTVLAQGSLIGYVGNTGNASGGAAHLHFEIHSNGGTPVDPFPRLTSEFTPAQKMVFLSTIFGQSSDPVALAQFLVTNFRSTFTSAMQTGVTLPPLITGALATVPVSSSSSTGNNLPAGDLMLGSSGTAVVTLQQFLIAKAVGPAAVRLAGAGPTGNFGPITETALIEYQRVAGITPPDGYYGPLTKAAVAANLGVSQPPATTPPVGSSTVTFTRNLYLGISGQDVLALQKLLNVHGFTVSVSGAGSYGNETLYFGPATQAAVIKFQLSRSIVPAVGYVGPITRTALMTLI